MNRCKITTGEEFVFKHVRTGEEVLRRFLLFYFYMMPAHSPAVQNRTTAAGSICTELYRQSDSTQRCCAGLWVFSGSLDIFFVLDTSRDFVRRRTIVRPRIYTLPTAFK